MTDLEDAIDSYFELEEKIKKTLGWVDTWKLLPLEDNRRCYWMLAGGDKKTGDGSTVVTSEKPITLKAAKKGNEISGSEVYTQRHHDKWVFRAEGVVLIPVDTHTDGNILLLLLDEKKEIKDTRIEECYRRYWGDGGDGNWDEGEDKDEEDD
jgi:hypothetical protein